MTSRTTALIRNAGKPDADKVERYPDFPPRDDMQNWLYLYKTTIAASLDFYFANCPNIDVDCEIPVGPSVSNRSDIRIPDMSVMKDGNRALMLEQGGYAIDSQGKAPDLALEVASPTTGVADYTDKRSDYERYGVREYWRFDPSGGRFHDAALAGDRLVEGRYEPVEIEWLDDGRGRGYSEVLELYLYWDDGMLWFYDPETQAYIRTHKDEFARANTAETRADDAEARADAAEAEAHRLRERLQELKRER